MTSDLKILLKNYRQKLFERQTSKNSDLWFCIKMPCGSCRAYNHETDQCERGLMEEKKNVLHAIYLREQGNRKPTQLSMPEVFRMPPGTR